MPAHEGFEETGSETRRQKPTKINLANVDQTATNADASGEPAPSTNCYLYCRVKDSKS